MNNIDDTELERRRSAAHRVEVIEEAVGGALLMAAAAALMWLYCKATPEQLSGESDWSAGVEARTEPRHALPMVTLSENGESAAGAVQDAQAQKRGGQSGS